MIRDPLGTGLGAKPVCNTDVFCFAPPDTPYDSLPPGVLHPKAVAHGVVAGVRDYGNRMGIPTVNGAVFFDDRYLGNPLVWTAGRPRCCRSIGRTSGLRPAITSSRSAVERAATASTVQRSHQRC